MGLYAENCVARKSMSWPERIELTYYREKTREVDFVLTHGGNRYLPIEVKHRTRIDQISGLKSFMARFRLSFGCIINARSDGELRRQYLVSPATLLSADDIRSPGTAYLFRF